MGVLPTIVGLGEVLWDVFPDGPRFGGAPANFVGSVAELDETLLGRVVSAVGDDQLGRDARTRLEERGVDCQHLQTVARPTGQVLVTLDREGHASYEFTSDTAYDNIPWNDELRQLASQSEAVCFGTLAQRGPISRETIHRFLKATPTGGLRVFDVNLRPPYWDEETIRQSLALANVLKLNDEELPLVAAIFGWKESGRELLSRIVEAFELRLLVLTQGRDGATLMDNKGSYSQQPGREIKVVDTVGAGDAFTAAVVVGFYHAMPLDAINRWATRVAGYVASQPGATPDMPSELCYPPR